VQTEDYFLQENRRDITHLLGGILQVEKWLAAPLQEESQLVFFRGRILLALRAWSLVQHLVKNSAIQPETFCRKNSLVPNADLSIDGKDWPKGLTVRPKHWTTLD
jgi:hypothetical protein